MVRLTETWLRTTKWETQTDFPCSSFLLPLICLCRAGWSVSSWLSSFHCTTSKQNKCNLRLVREEHGSASVLLKCPFPLWSSLERGGGRVEGTVQYLELFQCLCHIWNDTLTHRNSPTSKTFVSAWGKSREGPATTNESVWVNLSQWLRIYKIIINIWSSSTGNPKTVHFFWFIRYYFRWSYLTVVPVNHACKIETEFSIFVWIRKKIPRINVLKINTAFYLKWTQQEILLLFPPCYALFLPPFKSVNAMFVWIPFFFFFYALT